MGVGLDLLGRRKDGSDFPVDISLRPVLLEQAVHVVGAIRDMTAQRLLERERAQQAERLHLQAELINLVHDAILVRDPISRVLSWNRGAEELYGWTEEEALGRVTHVLLKTHFLASLPEIDAQLKREGRWEGKLMHTRRDGRLVVVESRWVLVRDAQGRTIATLEINRISPSDADWNKSRPRRMPRRWPSAPSSSGCWMLSPAVSAWCMG